MVARWIPFAGCLVGAVWLLTTSCVGTHSPAPAGCGRMEELVGMAAVQAVMTPRPGRSVLIYHSPRCDFCRATLMSVEAVLPDLGPQAVVYTLDIDSNPEVRDALDIGPVPVVVFLENGQEVKRWRVYRPGFIARGALRRFLAGSSTTG